MRSPQRQRGWGVRAPRALAGSPARPRRAARQLQLGHGGATGSSSSTGGAPCSDAIRRAQRERPSAFDSAHQRDDDAVSSRSGVLADLEDADWFKYKGDDTTFNFVDPTREITTQGSLRLCKFVQCDDGNPDVSCPGGTTPEMSPDGRSGCCGSGGFDLGIECSGIDDNAWVYIRSTRRCPSASITRCLAFLMAAATPGLAQAAGRGTPCSPGAGRAAAPGVRRAGGGPTPASPPPRRRAPLRRRRPTPVRTARSFGGAHATGAPSPGAGEHGGAHRGAAQHVLVAYKGAKNAPRSVTRSKADARKRAEEARTQAAGGADFAKVVEEYSDDAVTRERLGSLGKFAHGGMVKPFADAAFALPVGGISEVVETDFGFHVIKRNQ